MKNPLLVALVVIVALFILYQYDNTLFGILGGREGWADAPKQITSGSPKQGSEPSAAPSGPGAMPGKKQEDATKSDPHAALTASQAKPSSTTSSTITGKNGKKEGFADLAAYEGPASFGSAEAPAGCYPRDQLTPGELLPKDMNSIWAQQNPMGTGSLKGKNFLSAGALIGINTVGQSLRNANQQLRSEIPNPQTPISIFNNSTITPDISHRPLEIG
jgi:hypothetical protein